MRGADARRRPLPLPGHGGQAPLPHAWRIGRLGAPRGNRNADKSGDYTKAAIEARQALRDLLRAARKTIEDLR